MKQLTDDRLAEFRRQARDSDQLAERYWQWIFADLVIAEFCRINGITGEAQPAREWVGLTEKELWLAIDGCANKYEACRVIMSRLREKNAGLPAADDKALGYAKRLAQSMWEAEYKNTAPNWQFADDLLTVLTQIDNMASGLCRKSDDKAGGEPVSFLANATRYKVVQDSLNGCKIYGLPIELSGRWVALVAADDDCHLKYTHPQPQDDLPAILKKQAS